MQDTRRQHAHELLGMALRDARFVQKEYGTVQGAPSKAKRGKAAPAAAVARVAVTVTVRQTGDVVVPVRWDAAGAVLQEWKSSTGARPLFVAKVFTAGKDATTVARHAWAYTDDTNTAADASGACATMHACLVVVPMLAEGGFALEYRAPPAAPAVAALPDRVTVALTRVFCMGHECSEAGARDNPVFEVRTSHPFFPQLVHALQLGPRQYDEDELLLAWDADDALLMGSMAEAPHACRVTLRQQLGAHCLRAAASTSLEISYSRWPRRLDKGGKGLPFVSKRVKTTALEQCTSLRPTPPALDPLDTTMAMFGRTAEETAGLLAELLAREDARALPVDMARRLGLSECSSAGVAAIQKALKQAAGAADSGAPLHLPPGGAHRARALVADACRLELEQRSQRDHSAVVRYSHFKDGNLRTLIASRFDRSASNRAAFLRAYAQDTSDGAWATHSNMAKLGEAEDRAPAHGSLFFRARVPFSYTVSPGDTILVYVGAEESVCELRAALCAKLRAHLHVPPTQVLELGGLAACGLRGLLYREAGLAADPAGEPPREPLQNALPIENLEAALVYHDKASVAASVTVFLDGVYVVTNGRTHNRADPSKHLMLTWWFAELDGDGDGDESDDSDGAAPPRAPSAALQAEIDALNGQASMSDPPKHALDRQIRSITWAHNDTLFCHETSPGVCSVVQNYELVKPYCVSFEVPRAWLLLRVQLLELQFRRPRLGWELAGTYELHDAPPAPAPADKPAGAPAAAALPAANPRRFRSLLAAMMATEGITPAPPAGPPADFTADEAAAFAARRVLDVIFANSRGDAAAHEEHCRRVNLYLWQDLHLDSAARALMSVLEHKPAAAASTADERWAGLPAGLAVLLFKYWERGKSAHAVVLRDARVSTAPLADILSSKYRTATNSTLVHEITTHMDGEYTVGVGSVPFTAVGLGTTLDLLSQAPQRHGVTSICSEKQRGARPASAGAHARMQAYARFAELDMDRYTPHRQGLAHRRATSTRLAAWLEAVQRALPRAAAADIDKEYHIAYAVQELRTNAVRALREFNAEAPAEYWRARQWHAPPPADFWTEERVVAAHASPVARGHAACPAGPACRSHASPGLCCDAHLAEPLLPGSELLARYPGLLGGLRMHVAEHGDVHAPGGGAAVCLQDASLLAYCASRQHHVPARGLHAVREALGEVARLLALNVYLYAGADPAREEYNSETAGPLPCPAGMFIEAPGDSSAAHNVLLRVDAQLREFTLLTWLPSAAGTDAARARFLHATREVFKDASFCTEFKQRPPALARTQPDPLMLAHKSPELKAPSSKAVHGEWLRARVWHAQAWQRCDSFPSSNLRFLSDCPDETKHVDFFKSLSGENPARRSVGAVALAPGYETLHHIRSIANDGALGDLGWELVAGAARAAEPAQPAQSVPVNTDALHFVCAHAGSSVPHALGAYAQRRFAAGMSVYVLRPSPACGILHMCRVVAVREDAQHGASCACMDLVDSAGTPSAACRFGPTIARIPAELCFGAPAEALTFNRRVSTADLHAVMQMHLSVGQGARLVRLFLEVLQPPHSAALPARATVYTCSDGLLLTQDAPPREWVAGAAGPLPWVPLLGGAGGYAAPLLGGAGGYAAPAEPPTPVSVFELLALVVLERNSMPMHVERELVLVARDCILLHMHRTQPLWETSFLCSSCNCEVSRSRADNSDPGADGATCLACATRIIMAAVSQETDS